MTSIKIIHNAGFFSCCSARLTSIVDFINLNEINPTVVDSSAQFNWYKNNTKKDITYDYFEHYDNVMTEIKFPIRYNHTHQYHNYLTLDYENICPLVKKYFSPSVEINEIIDNIEQKYDLNYNNICALHYRGNDKIRETTLCNYKEYLTHANEILEKNPNTMFLIQSDETQFIDFITNAYPNNSFFFNDEIRHMDRCNDTVDKVFKNTNYDFSKKYLAITIIMSKCKYIICGSGNCSIWIMLYRNNNNNTIQFMGRNARQWYKNLTDCIDNH